ncbi:MAG: RT0821/Lpp0805 family surface protein [Alphaproteobacteria bacterium]
MRRFAVLSIVGALAVAGCDTTQGGMGGMGQKQTGGAVVGALGGGLLGSTIGRGQGRLWAVGAGTLIGALVGSEVGRSLDKADQAHAARAYERAYTAPVGETISWRNPDSGNYGTITPSREGRAHDGRYCREYQSSIYVGGQYEQGVGVACRNPDGSWQIVS